MTRTLSMFSVSACPSTDSVGCCPGGTSRFCGASTSQSAPRVRVRGTKEELALVYRSKVLNPKFVEGLKRHGYRGVSEIANLTEYTFGWDATSDVVDDWMYQKLTERYLFDDDTREWMEDENPHAMMDIMDRLFEAIDRRMWDADQETVDRLKDIYLELESRVEEVNDR